MFTIKRTRWPICPNPATQEEARQILLEVGRQVVERAFRNRHRHAGYMAHYPQAKALVDRVRAGGQGPVFASWF